MDANYYIKRKGRLLRDFDGVIKRVLPLLEERYGSEWTRSMLAEARQEYEALIPRLPYVGGVQPLTQFVVATGWFLAMYRVFQRQGRTVDEVARLAYDMTEHYLKVVPGFARGLLGHMTFSPRYARKLQKGARESQERRYPDGYVFAYVEGNGEEFDYGVDYLECATCKFLQREGAMELQPYLCALDHLHSKMMGWGLTRTKTLAEGYDRCDFRFKKGGPTRVASKVMDLS